jgi:hypothetical protein
MDNKMTQVKFTIESDVVATFKARCAAEGVSMTSVIRKWMNENISAKSASIDTSTRPHRRKAVKGIIGSLNIIIDSESEYRDSIPEQFIQRCELADYACDMLVEAINCLEEAF